MISLMLLWSCYFILSFNHLITRHGVDLQKCVELLPVICFLCLNVTDWSIRDLTRRVRCAGPMPRAPGNACSCDYGACLYRGWNDQRLGRRTMNNDTSRTKENLKISWNIRKDDCNMFVPVSCFKTAPPLLYVVLILETCVVTCVVSRAQENENTLSVWLVKSSQKKKKSYFPTKWAFHSSGFCLRHKSNTIG